jgi:hypothetical protein
MRPHGEVNLKIILKGLMKTKSCGFVASNSRIFVNYELERVRKEAVVA